MPPPLPTPSALHPTGSRPAVLTLERCMCNTGQQHRQKRRGAAKGGHLGTVPIALQHSDRCAQQVIWSSTGGAMTSGDGNAECARSNSGFCISAPYRVRRVVGLRLADNRVDKGVAGDLTAAQKSTGHSCQRRKLVGSNASGPCMGFNHTGLTELSKKQSVARCILNNLTPIPIQHSATGPAAHVNRTQLLLPSSLQAILC
jgi:hypothetical protein